MTGKTLGHYRIDSKLGEGGMGVVYLAQDTHLDRRVAVKVLPPEAVANPERKRRFVQEAKAASALNHPNIVTIYDIDSADGVDYIAMEFVPGRSLDQVIGRKGMKVGESLHYAVQIADALARAHQAGIVHRDLKPGNIMVTDEGRVKVLDFGLAKLIERGLPGAESEATRTLAAAHAARTQEGTILGTVAYMSPEQAEGKDVDGRSDVFSLGSVIYEMLTGRRAFQGGSTVSTLAAVINQEPPPMGAVAPPELERVVARALRKDPRRRFQVMEDFHIAIEELKQDLDAGRLATAPAPFARRTSPAWLAATAAIFAVIFAAVGIGAGLWWSARSGANAGLPAMILTRLTSDAGLATDPAFSPDGKLIAYASDRAGKGDLDIWVQQVSGGEPVRLTRDKVDESQPSFSPDGGRIAFRSERDRGGIFVVSALGGEPRRIAELGRRPRFSPDGKQILYWVGVHGVLTGVGGLFLVPSTGGAPKALRPEFSLAREPLWSPDGSQVLFMGSDQKEQGQIDWWITPVSGGTPVRTGASAALVRAGLSPSPLAYFVPFAWSRHSGEVLFSARTGDSTNLWAVRISADGTLDSAPRRITSGTAMETEPATASLDGGRGSAFQTAFAALEVSFDLWTLALDANRGRASSGWERLTQDQAMDRSPAFSADGTRLVYISERSGPRDVWVRDLGTGRENAVTANQVAERPVPNPDGTKVLYVANRSSRPEVFLTPVSFGGFPGAPHRIVENCDLWDWSADESKVLCGNEDISRLDLADLASGRRTVLLERKGHVLARGRFSPDQRRFAVHARLGGRSKILVAPLKESLTAADWIDFTSGDSMDAFATWSPDGRLLYFLSNRDGALCVWACRLDPATARPEGEPFPVRHFHETRRSLANMQVTSFNMSIARDRLVLNLAETTGNIWVARFPNIAEP